MFPFDYPLSGHIATHGICNFCQRPSNSPLGSSITSAGPTCESSGIQADGHNWCGDCFISKAAFIGVYWGRFLQKEAKGPAARYNGLKSSAKRRGIAFSITKEEFERWWASATKACSYCLCTKFELDAAFIKITIDRKDNSRGYEVGNLCLACEICNRSKNSALSFDSMKVIGEKCIRPQQAEIVRARCQLMALWGIVRPDSFEPAYSLVEPAAGSA